MNITLNELTEKIIGSAIKVHRTLGPGFLEAVYQAALAHELKKAKISFEKEKALPVVYGKIFLDVGFRCDFLIDKRVIIECKAVRDVTPLDHAQLLNYLKITKLQVGLLINFNVRMLTSGIKRIVNKYNE
ncbi:MAG: GxxExxY protein [Desulfosarcina sp.]|nr:GxxExxY protein [Desulfobacterales bacterium]